MLFHYMAAEILAGECKDVRHFMEAIAVLEEITPRYCDMLLHRSDSGELLSTLKSKYFFLVPLDGRQGAYRYQPLFREFLLEQLGDAKFALLERAGSNACQTGEPEQGVEYFIAAGRLEKAQEVIIKEGKKLMGKGNWQTVERWLNSLTPLVRFNPWLILYKAQIEVNHGRIFAGENLANQALKAFSGTNDVLGMAESRLLKAKILRCQGRYQESLKLLETAIPDLTGNEAEEWFDPLLELSYTLIMCGRFREAEEVLNRALSRAEQQGDPVLMTYFCEGLGNLYFAWGYPDRSLYFFRRGMAISPDKILRNYYFQDAVGPIYQDWGNLDLALEYLQQSVTAKENFGPTESLPSAYNQLGDVLLDRGDALQAEEYYRKGLEIMESQGGDHFVLVLTHLSLAVCLGAQGRVVEAEAEVEKAKSESKGQSDFITACFQMVETLFLLQTGNVEAAYPLLQNQVQVLEPLGARKLLCVTYASLALIGILRRDEKEIAAFAENALQLAAEMNFAHDFLISYEVFKPLLYLGFERV
jgi:ATP/maltotriose-dependent transcriptional regulator MalT